MNCVDTPQLFSDWRNQAREALAAGEASTTFRFAHAAKAPQSEFLFDSSNARRELPQSTSIPAPILKFLKLIACHKNPERWKLMYQLVQRIAAGERNILENPADSLTNRLRLYQKQIRRDRHKMTAFVRFRELSDGSFLAFYRPEHYIVELTAPFFQKRFGAMTWSICTPFRSVHWDRSQLRFGPGIVEDPFADEDNFEALWLQYYQSIFNPARVKIQAMKNEMPTRYWSTMPETRLISQMLKEAPARIRQMQEFAPQAAQVPEVHSSEELATALQNCRACSLYKDAQKVVPGHGPSSAKLVCVGEQPGDEEDQQGLPFIGPAGKVLSDLLHRAGIARKGVYLTNAVKHFKFTTRGKARLHARPRGVEINCCKPWLLKELELIQPSVIVLLGATAAQAILGKKVVVKDEHLQLHRHGEAACIVTYHPSAILRQPNEERRNSIESAILESLALAQTLFAPEVS